MRTIKNIFMLLLATIACINCSPEDPIESSVTEYATFEMTGGEYLLWQEGTPYEEPGVTALAGEETLEVETTGSVNSDVPGVYSITYSANNADGFPATITRYVAVGDVETAANRDLSGNYDPENEVTKIADGFYQNSDILAPNGIRVFMVDLGNGSLVIPPQSTPYGTVVADPNVNPDTEGILNSEDSFTLVVEIGPNGIFNPTFEK